MPESIPALTSTAMTFDYITILLRLVLSVVSGVFIAMVYRISHGREKPQDSHVMFATLVLLCIFIAMVSMVIGNSVAMAFSLVGALSIVRFRTVVEDTRDTAFVIFSVITGMAMGSGHFAVPAIGVPIASAVAIGLHRRNPGLRNSKASLKEKRMWLTIKIGIGRDFRAIVAQTSEYFTAMQLNSTGTTRQGAAIEAIYQVRLKPNTDPIDIISTINSIDGVQSIELKPLKQGRQ